MEKLLPYLQPRLFTLYHNEFNYEVVAVKEHFEDEDGIAPTGNYIVFVLSPKGTEQFTLTADGDVWHDDEEDVQESSPDAFEIPEVFDNLPESTGNISFPHPHLPEEVLKAIQEKLK